jgi:hypothetical protein
MHVVLLPRYHISAETNDKSMEESEMIGWCRVYVLWYAAGTTDHLRGTVVTVEGLTGGPTTTDRHTIVRIAAPRVH